MASKNFGDYKSLIGHLPIMGTGDRIREGRVAKGLSQQSVADLIGVSRPAVTQWEQDKIVPDRGNLRKLANTLGVSELWLLEGIGDAEGQALMPVQGEVAAGVWRETNDTESRSIPLARHPDFPATSQYALLVRGDSLNKIANDGDFLHVVDVQDAGILPTSGDVVVVMKHRHGLAEATVKRLLDKNGGYELHPESTNPEYAGAVSLEPTDEDTEILITAKVIGKYTLLYHPKT